MDATIKPWKPSDLAIYKPNDIFKLEVLVSDDTVWLTQSQMADLFQKDRTVITKHIKNIFNENELEEKCNVQKMHFANSDKPISYYNLDVIISVGYRVKSKQGTKFRQWANKILKEYLLRGYSFNQYLFDFEQRMNNQLQTHSTQIEELQEQVGQFIHNVLPPQYGLFCDGQIFDSYVFISNLIKSARKNIKLIDNYIDESVLVLLDKRSQNVSAIVYTQAITPKMQLDLRKHNKQYNPIVIKTIKNIHDRFLLIDESLLYHIGASIKDLGKKMFAMTRIEEPELVNKLRIMIS